jgi:2-polyprenyl-6-methoxyphenol hydroxylase-like FAD-dependent oxidoreductase
MAGRAACLHLARAGMKVTCIEPRTEIEQPVGESLDRSSPELLKALGLPMEQLVSTSVATWLSSCLGRLGGDSSMKMCQRSASR